MGSSPVPPGFLFPAMTKTEICNLALTKIGQKTLSSIDDPNDKNARLCAIHYAQALDELLRAGFWSFAKKAAKLTADITAANSYPRTVSGINAAAVGSWIFSSVISGRPSFVLPGLAGSRISWNGTLWRIYDGANFLFTSAEDVAGPELVTTWTRGASGTGSPLVTTTFPDEIHPWEKSYALPPDFLKLRKVSTNDGLKLDRFDLRRVNVRRSILANADPIRILYIYRNDTPGDYDPSFIAALVTLLASKLARAISGSDELESTLLQRFETLDLPKARTDDGHDVESDENHPLQDLLDGDLIGRRGTAWDEDY
jgi:hypothetical protein